MNIRLAGRLTTSSALASIAMCAAAQATTLTTSLNVDNVFNAYLSTDDTAAGTLFGTGDSWPTTYTNSVDLIDGVTNYLHIEAIDINGPAALLGQFTLSDTAFSFSNGTQLLLSGDAGLTVSETGWSSYGATTDYGENGVLPWGVRTDNAAAARWVWSDDNENDNLNYYSVTIVPSIAAVPLPASLPVFLAGLGLAGYLTRRGRS